MDGQGDRRMFRTASRWLAVCAAVIFAIGPAAATAHAHAHASDRAYHFGFKKSKNGAPASIEQEGFKPILQKHGAIFLGDTRAKSLYLTFDNGYENGYTVQVLDVLKAKKVKAAFFVTGHYVKDQPALVKRMVQEGHLIGNHSWSHPDMTQISDSKIIEELDKVKRLVAEVSDQKEMRFMRPPRGIFNDRMLGVSKASGYTNVFWSVAYKDWEVNNQKGGDYAYRKVIEQLHPGAVILLHSVSKDNAEALGRIIDEARRQGYEFQTLDQLTDPTLPIMPTMSTAKKPPDPPGATLTVLHEGQVVAGIHREDYILSAFPLLRPDKLELLLQKLERQVNKPPRNAVIGEHGEIVPEQNGVKLDRQKMASQLAFYLYGFERAYIEAPIVTQYAKVDSELIGQLRGKRLSHYFTYYNAGNKARAHNIALAAKAIDSAVVFPGERFSFNRVVGMRTTAKGYKRAPIIVKGEFNDSFPT